MDFEPDLSRQPLAGGILCPSWRRAFNPYCPSLVLRQGSSKSSFLHWSLITLCHGSRDWGRWPWKCLLSSRLRRLHCWLWVSFLCGCSLACGSRPPWSKPVCSPALSKGHPLFYPEAPYPVWNARVAQRASRSGTFSLQRATSLCSSLYLLAETGACHGLYKAQLCLPGDPEFLDSAEPLKWLLAASTQPLTPCVSL